MHRAFLYVGSYQRRVLRARPLTRSGGLINQ